MESVTIEDYKMVLTHLYWLTVDKCKEEETPWDFDWFKESANLYGITEDNFELSYDPYETCFE